MIILIWIILCLGGGLFGNIEVGPHEFMSANFFKLLNLLYDIIVCAIKLFILWIEILVFTVYITFSKTFSSFALLTWIKLSINLEHSIKWSIHYNFDVISVVDNGSLEVKLNSIDYLSHSNVLLLKSLSVHENNL